MTTGCGLRLSPTFGLALLVGFAATAASAQDVRVWLERMNRAVEELNYRGTYVHMHGDIAETVEIVHGFQDGAVNERLLSLDGAGREIVRDPYGVQCILPDKRVVLLEPSSDRRSLASALPNYSVELAAHYDFKPHGASSIVRRPAQIIGIRPRDSYRYGYLLWLDEATGMPLKMRMRDEDNEIVEQILFTQFELLDSVPAESLRATIDTRGFSLRNIPESTTIADSEISWQASSLPAGFGLSIAKRSPLLGSGRSAEHLVYSDGLATVSVFIADADPNAELQDGFSRVGSTSTFSLTLDGRKITAVGEVPRETVQVIASSLSQR